MVSIVMPAYNEEEIIEKTVREWYERSDLPNTGRRVDRGQ